METTLLLSPTFCAEHFGGAHKFAPLAECCSPKTLKVEQNRIDKILTPGDNAQGMSEARLN